LEFRRVLFRSSLWGMPQRDCWWCIPVAKYGVLLFTESGAVVITDYILDGMRQGDQGGLSETLRQCFFSNGTSDTAIAIFKRVDAYKIQVGNTRTCQRRQWVAAIRCRVLKPFHKAVHFLHNLLGWWCFKMNEGSV